MDVQSLKEHMLNNDLVQEVLQEIGCHSVRDHREYLTCGNHDGDNRSAIVVYLNENLTVVNYTRKMVKEKRATDIFDLICYNKQCTFPESLKFTCQLFGLDFYSEICDVPEALQIIQMLKQMENGNYEEEERPLKPIDEKILSYYLPHANQMFKNDGIDYFVQQDFEIGYDPVTNRITIPIRDEFGTLCGIKARLMKEQLDECDMKYIYLEPCPKSRVLYGYWQNKGYIKRSQYVYVFESEKAVMQAASYGVRATCATGGKTISKAQIEILTRMGCQIIFAYDSDVEYSELEEIADMFAQGVPVYALYDSENILGEKESPTDNEEKFKYMMKNNMIKLK